MKSFITTALFVLLFVANNSFACDCNKIVSRGESKVVFTGLVKKVQKSKGGLGYRVVLKVARRLKGENISKRIIIYTPCLEEICCGVPFKKGGYFFVVTIGVDGNLFANRCTATGEITKEIAYNY